MSLPRLHAQEPGGLFWQSSVASGKANFFKVIERNSRNIEPTSEDCFNNSVSLGSLEEQNWQE